MFQKTCDHVFDDKLKQNCPFTKIFGTLITKSIGHRQMFLFPRLTYLVQLLYRGKFSRPKYQQKLNKIMKISQKMWFWLKIPICQSSMVHKGSWVNCPTRVGNLDASTVSWREATKRVQLSRNQAAVDCICHIAVKDLVLNQEDKPKKHRSAR